MPESPEHLRAALDAIELDESGTGMFGPTEFLSYCDLHGLPRPRQTASVLSIDSFSGLRPYLRKAGAMVFRLGGNADNLTRTRFAVAKVPEGPHCFFFHDNDVFEHPQIVTDADPLGEDRFLGYTLANKLQEMALVNLGLGSGILGECLGLEEPIIHAPAMFNSRYSFRLRLHDRLPHVLDHSAGQVQIDGLFTAMRQEDRTLFILEAKFVRRNSSLAKHKLVYPYLGMRQQMKYKGPIVPVYLSVLERDDHYVYRMVECELDEPDEDVPVLADLTPRTVSQVTVPKRGGLLP